MRAAIAAHKEINAFNEERLVRGESPIEAGIGLHSGDVILGIVGDKYRRSGNVISDTVNLAARIEGLTKTYGVRIAASAEVIERAVSMEPHACRFVDEVRVKGRKRGVRVFEIYGGDDADQVEKKRQSRELFASAVGLYRDRAFAEAGELFATILADNPADRAAQLLRSRCERYVRSGAPLDWGGSEELTDE